MYLESNRYKSFFYPPGGILLWLIIFVEMLSFGFALIAFAYYRSLDPDTFRSSGNLINANLATLNTILLLLSGFFMANAVKQFHIKAYKSAQRASLFAMMGGLLFISIKLFEYYGKLENGYTLSFNMFFTFYWLLTGFHLIHVLTGLVILYFLSRKLKQHPEQLKPEDFEAGAAFWHMCDLIWLLLFPVLYLF